MLCPRQFPQLHFVEGGKLDRQFKSTIHKFLNLLAWMPDAFMDEWEAECGEATDKLVHGCLGRQIGDSLGAGE
jgi:hypothetical protein